MTLFEIIFGTASLTSLLLFNVGTYLIKKTHYALTKENKKDLILMGIAGILMSPTIAVPILKYILCIITGWNIANLVKYNKEI